MFFLLVLVPVKASRDLLGKSSTRAARLEPAGQTERSLEWQLSLQNECIRRRFFSSVGFLYNVKVIFFYMRKIG